MSVCPGASTTPVRVVHPTSTLGRVVLREYMSDVASRYYGRPATREEVDAALRDDPSDDLVPPRGALVVAVEDGAVLGCAGLRLLPDGVATVTRVYVAPAARRRGLGASLVTEVERLAREHGARTLRLDTRADLVEARRLYSRLGFGEVPAFNRGRYAEHWFAKTLS